MAERTGLSLERVKWLCKKLSKAQELPFRSEAAFLPEEILWEDEDLLIVNKPAGLKAQPRHRWEGGSLINKAIKHLNVGKIHPVCIV